MRFFFIFPVFCSLVFAQNEQSIAHLAQMLFQAQQENQLTPLVSQKNPNLNTAIAYDIQKTYVKKRLHTEKIAGFKAGLTSKAGQRKFGVEAPVAGVLFVSGKKEAHTTIKKSLFKKLMVETEIGFITKKDIGQVIKNTSELKEYIAATLPVIELPDLGFSNLKALKGVDIIASNVASAQFILGKEKPITEINKITVTLTNNGHIVNQGKATDAMGGQWQACLWLINTMVKEGWKIKKGNLLITGALGKMIPGHRGKYRADFGSLGEIQFEVK